MYCYMAISVVATAYVISVNVNCHYDTVVIGIYFIVGKKAIAPDRMTIKYHNIYV